MCNCGRNNNQQPAKAIEPIPNVVRGTNQALVAQSIANAQQQQQIQRQMMGRPKVFTNQDK